VGGEELAVETLSLPLSSHSIRNGEHDLNENNFCSLSDENAFGSEASQAEINDKIKSPLGVNNCEGREGSRTN
jgi:hypothetical protein